MDNIEFRGISIYNNKFVYGNLIQFMDEITTTVYIKTFNGELYEVFPETVGQYADLKDMHGTKMWVGDIVEDIDDEFDNSTFVVPPSKVILFSTG